MNRLKQFRFAKVWLSALLIPFSVLAEESAWFENSSFEGFVSDTAIYSSDYQFFSESDDSVSFDMWEAGLLFSTNVVDQVSFSGQLLGRRISQDSGNDLRLDYAFLSFPLMTNSKDSFGLRLGRIRSSFGFYNETRDIPHNRTGILMPQSVYYDMTRNSFYSADGVEFFANRDIGENRLGFQMFISKPVADDDETEEASYLNPTNLEGDHSFLAKISYGSEVEGFRYAFTYYRPEYDVDVNFIAPFDAATFGLPSAILFAPVDAKGSSFYSQTVLFSIEYNQLDWSLTAEYSRHKFQTFINADLASSLEQVFLPAPFPPGTTVASQLTPEQISAAQASLSGAGYEENFYIQGLYRFDEQWESYVRYDYNKGVGGGFTSPDTRWIDINVGGAYRPDEHWLLRGELHYIDGRSRLLKRDNVFVQGQDPYWVAALMQIAYRF